MIETALTKKELNHKNYLFSFPIFLIIFSLVVPHSLIAAVQTPIKIIKPVGTISPVSPIKPVTPVSTSTVGTVDTIAPVSTVQTVAPVVTNPADTQFLVQSVQSPVTAPTTFDIAPVTQIPTIFESPKSLQIGETSTTIADEDGVVTSSFTEPVTPTQQVSTQPTVLPESKALKIFDTNAAEGETKQVFGADPDFAFPDEAPPVVDPPVVTPPDTTPDDTNPTSKFLGDAFNKSANSDKGGGGGGGGGGGQFLEGRRGDSPSLLKSSVLDKDFVGGGIGAALKLLKKLSKKDKSKTKAKIQRDDSFEPELNEEQVNLKTETDDEKSKKKNSKKLKKKLMKSKEKEQTELTEKEKLLQQAGIIQADFLELENYEPIKEMKKEIQGLIDPNNFKLQVISDLTPVHKIQMIEPINKLAVAENVRSEKVHRIGKIVGLPIKAVQLMSLAQASPIKVQKIHQIVTEPGTTINEFGPASEDIFNES